MSAGSHFVEIPARASGRERSGVSWEGLAQAVLALLPGPALPAGLVGGCPQEQYVPGCQENCTISHSVRPTGSLQKNLRLFEKAHYLPKL